MSLCPFKYSRENSEMLSSERQERRRWWNPTRRGAAVRDEGGHIAAMDTDSAMIVSTKEGGLIPCAGGLPRLKDYRVPSRQSAIRLTVRVKVLFFQLKKW